MRLGLIGDVHAEDELLALTLETFRSMRLDRILCTGDVVDGHGDVDRAAGLLRTANVVIVRGNHDRWIRTDEMRSLPRAHRMTDLSVDTITFLKSLPSTVSLDIPSSTRPGKLLLCHGIGPNDMCRLSPEDHAQAISSNRDLLAILFDPTIRVMVGGHTHKPMLRRFERGAGKSPLFVVNPGTLARDHEPGFAVLDLVSERIDFHRIMPGHHIVHVACGML